jgi:hypothetical protein
MATRIQVVFYSMYGHVYRLAEAVSAGARKVAGTEGVKGERRGRRQRKHPSPASLPGISVQPAEL